MYQFKYHRADSVDDASEKLASCEDGVLLAGGMTLLPTMKQRLAAPSDVVDLAPVTGLNEIVSGDTLSIGAMTTHATVAASSHVKEKIPALAALAAQIGDPQVRNRGTIGGSVANADPAADYPAALVALNATVHTNKRTISADDFFVDLFETALEEHEIVTGVEFPVAKRAAYEKFPNPASHYAVVGVFVAILSDDSVRVAVTGAAGSVFRVAEMEQALEKDFSVAAIKHIKVDNDDFNEDIHASADYRAHLVNAIAKRAVANCAAA